MHETIGRKKRVFLFIWDVSKCLMTNVSEVSAGKMCISHDKQTKIYSVYDTENINIFWPAAAAAPDSIFGGCPCALCKLSGKLLLIDGYLNCKTFVVAGKLFDAARAIFIGKITFQFNLIHEFAHFFTCDITIISLGIKFRREHASIFFIRFLMNYELNWFAGWIKIIVNWSLVFDHWLKM